MSDADLAAKVANTDWYHTLELPGGIVTPGHFDCRPTVARLPLPASLAGMRCLDVGTWDGFWAFEMERRGAAEVVAIDIDDPERWDWPPHMRVGGGPKDAQLLGRFKDSGRGFRIARDSLGSDVSRVDLSVYELDPAIHGKFDFVFIGSLLLHLRDPIRALAAVRSVCDGEAVIADAVDLVPSLLRPRTPSARLEGVERPWWWLPNVAGLRRMAGSAGFEVVASRWLYFVPLGPSHARGSVLREWRRGRSASGREELVVLARGVPHTAVLARPRAEPRLEPAHGIPGR